MRHDLLHAKASVDWAVAQFPTLQQRISTWIDQNVYTAIRHLDANPTDDLLVAVEKEELPLEIVVSVGLCINAIRSGLDILATALAYRHSIPRPEKVYFPVAPSESIFLSMRGYKGSELVQGLPSPERSIIEGLRPYKGGNEHLWPLHCLDIMRKHKRLLETAAKPGALRVTGLGITYKPVAEYVTISAYGETVLGFINKGANAKVNLSSYVAINEPDLISRKPIIVTLDQFAGMASDFIKRFDGP